MSEKSCPVTDGGIYLLRYENGGNKVSLEEFLCGAFEKLRGKSWAKDQRVELVVVGTDEMGVDYVLNNPAIGTLDSFSQDYDGEMLITGRIDNARIKTVKVFNMVLRGKDAVILEADVDVPRVFGADYVVLLPKRVSISTHELKAFVDEMMALHMLSVAEYPAIRLLISKYN